MLKEIVGVKFRGNDKIYYFDPNNLKLKKGDKIIVETNLGKECGKVILSHKKVDTKEFNKSLKKVIRKANAKDFKTLRELENKNKYAKRACMNLVSRYNLEMKILDAQYTFDKTKVIISFSSENRVDFRKLVKNLSSKLAAKVELKQIRFRDEAKLIGGISHCGREFCCKSFMGEFKPVSIKMAKLQGMSLSPTKISGNCGKLMCCLRHEQEAYEELLKNMPKVGSIVKTDTGEGKVVEVNLISGNLKVKLTDKPEDSIPININIKDLNL